MSSLPLSPVARPAWFVAALLALFSVNAQVSDTTAPIVNGINIIPSNVDVRTAPAIVTVHVSTTDDLAGVSVACVQFKHTQGDQRLPSAFGACDYQTKPGVLAHEFEITFEVPLFARDGVWKIEYLNLWDKSNNGAFLRTIDLESRGLLVDLTVTSVSDVTLPALTGLSISPRAVDVSSADQTVTIQARLTDAESGIDQSVTVFRFVLRAQNAPDQSAWISNWQCANTGTDNDLLISCPITIPKDSQAGPWYVDAFEAYDRAGNRLRLTRGDIANLGFNPDFGVLSATPDFTPPEILAIEYAPRIIDTSDADRTVTATITVKDDRTGMQPGPTTPSLSFLHGVLLQSPSGRQSAYCCYFSPNWQLVSGTPQNGVWRAPITFPRYSEAGSWRTFVYGLKDRAFNQLNLSPDQLAVRGVSPSLVIYRPSETPDGTAGPGGGTVTDTVFGDRAKVIVPPGAFNVPTSVAIDVLADFTSVPNPAGFAAGSEFVSIKFNPSPSMPFPAPGLTITLPLKEFKTPGTAIQLFRLDPVLGTLTPAQDTSGKPLQGLVDPDGLSATFQGVARLSTVAAFFPSTTLGDVNGDGVVNCTDVSIVRASMGRRKGQPGFDARADLNRNDVVDIADLSMVTRQLPAGTVCR